MNRTLTVEGNPDLIRDPRSGAIVNTNNTAYNNAVRAHKLAADKDKKIESLSSDINTLQQDVEELKAMIREFKSIEELN